MGFLRVILGAIREFNSVSILLAFQSLSVSSKLDEFFLAFRHFFWFLPQANFLRQNKTLPSKIVVFNE